MTPLRQRMLEDMQIRHLAASTQRAYVEHVARFARHFGQSPAVAAVTAIAISGQLWVMLRFGILHGTLILLISTLVGTLPLTSDVSAWYAGRGLIAVGLTLALAIWSFRHALGGRKVLEGDFLDG